RKYAWPRTGAGFSAFVRAVRRVIRTAILERCARFATCTSPPRTAVEASEAHCSERRQPSLALEDSASSRCGWPRETPRLESSTSARECARTGRAEKTISDPGAILDEVRYRMRLD